MEKSEACLGLSNSVRPAMPTDMTSSSSVVVVVVDVVVVVVVVCLSFADPLRGPFWLVC